MENQVGITCEAIDEPVKSSKAIDKRVIINFRDKNEVFVLLILYMSHSQMLEKFEYGLPAKF